MERGLLPCWQKAGGRALPARLELNRGAGDSEVGLDERFRKANLAAAANQCSNRQMNGDPTQNRPPAIEPEIVTEIPRYRPQDAPHTAASGPVHPLAAVTLLVVDNLWNVADWAVITWVATVPLAFVSVFVPTFFLHRSKLGQSPGKALAWAALLGGIAAVPFSVAGTATGALLLAWLGINQLSSRAKSN